MSYSNICEKFHSDPSTNPKTGCRIQHGKSTYNELVSLCGIPPSLQSTEQSVNCKKIPL